MDGPDDLDARVPAPSSATYSATPTPDAASVLEGIRAAKAIIDAMGPVAEEIATNPAERLGLLDLLPRFEPSLFANGLPIRTDPDVPLGEWWVKKSDGTHEAHRGGVVPKETR